MISHKHKCIFVHIPRCAGTSMEYALVKQDWWSIDRETKHILASTAKKLYGEHWDKYFKFSFVRNPWDRMVSLAKFPLMSGISISKGSINISSYLKKFDNIEIDPRSKSKKDRFDPVKGAVYLNILNEDLDFIGKFENLQEDFDTVCDKIEVPQRVLPHREKLKHKHYTEYYDDETRELVAEKYKKDIEMFGYKFGH